MPGRTTTGTPDDDIGLMLIELGLGDADSSIEVVVGQDRVDDLMAVLGEAGRLHAAGS